jgi:hypothetical protein
MSPSSLGLKPGDRAIFTPDAELAQLYNELKKQVSSVRSKLYAKYCAYGPGSPAGNELLFASKELNKILEDHKNQVYYKGEET